MNHCALFSKLIDRFIPVNIILLLSNWYSIAVVGIVNWRGALSQLFALQAGVRQGGCLSPVLFAIELLTVDVEIKRVAVV